MRCSRIPRHSSPRLINSWAASWMFPRWPKSSIRVCIGSVRHNRRKLSPEPTMNQSPAISIQHLAKSYGKVQALRDVNLEVQRGEVFGFLGPNGAGKTTTIRCLLDLIRPGSGSIRVLGIDPQTDPVAVRARSGYLPGELHVEDNLSTEALLRYFDQLRGNHLDWSFVHELAERLQIDLKLTIKNLSKGNKQKVGLMQALMHRPELLLLDEPTIGLDPLIQQEVLKLIREAKANGAT